jgi:hypothetical protein
MQKREFDTGSKTQNKEMCRCNSEQKHSESWREEYGVNITVKVFIAHMKSLKEWVIQWPKASWDNLQSEQKEEDQKSAEKNTGQFQTIVGVSVYKRRKPRQ